MHIFKYFIFILLLILFALFIKTQNFNGRYAEQSIGIINISDEIGGKYSCVATQMSSNSILTARHCFNNINPNTIQFKSSNGFLYSIDPIAMKNALPIESLSDFNNDPILLTTSSEIVGVTAFLHTHKSQYIESNSLYYLETRYGKPKFIKCNSSYKIDFGLIASDNCVLPAGMSGTPLFQFIEGEWMVVGMYHAYMKTHDKTYGVISLMENWSL